MPEKSLADNSQNANPQKNISVAEPLPEIRAKRIVLVDDDGQERARLHVNLNHETVFSLHDQHGELKMSLRVAEEDSNITIISDVDTDNANDNAERIFIGYEMQTERGIAQPLIRITDSKGDDALCLDVSGVQNFSDGKTDARPDPKVAEPPAYEMNVDEIEQAVKMILAYHDEEAADAFFRLIRAINATKNNFDKEKICYSAMNFSFRETRQYADGLGALMEGQER